jgi:hypothetical protein
MPDVDITEFEEIDPEELHLVGKGANGFKALLAKSASEEVRAVLDTIAEHVGLEVVKADDDDGGDDDGKPACPTCKGKGKILEGNRQCPKCLGSGKKPAVGDSAKAIGRVNTAEGARVTGLSGLSSPPLVSTQLDPAAAISSTPAPAGDAVCAACNGTGMIVDSNGNEEVCPHCQGMPGDLQVADISSESLDAGDGRLTDDGFPGRISNANKALATYEGLLKAKYKQKDRDKMASGGQAMSDGAYPVADSEDLDNAIHAVGRGGADHDAIRKHIIGRAKALNLSSKIPDNWNADGSLATKSVELVTKDGVTTGVNPFLGGAVTTNTTDSFPTDTGVTASTDGSTDDDADDDDDGTGTPGSPAWEAVDAQIASDAANAILQAYELTRQFRDREAIEVAAGEGNDVFDTFEASCVLDLLSAAIGQMATLSFHEGIAAQKSTEEVAEKAGKRLSTKSVTALAAARDHLTQLLGDDDPAKASDDSDEDDDASKSERDVLNMTPDELTELVAATVAKAVVEVEKGKTAADAKVKGKSAKKKAAVTDDTDNADQGDADSETAPPADATKAEADETAEPVVELTPEQIEAKKARKAAKKELRKAEEVEHKAAEDARVAALITERVEKATAEVEGLKSEIEAMKHRLIPNGPAKTSPPGIAAKAAERDVLELEVSKYERMAKDTSDRTLEQGYLDLAKASRDKLANL